MNHRFRSKVSILCALAVLGTPGLVLPALQAQAEILFWDDFEGDDFDAKWTYSSSGAHLLWVDFTT